MKTKKCRAVSVSLTVVCMCGLLSVSALGLELIPVGRAIGIEAEVDGVLVDKLRTVETPQGEASPGKNAGIKEGDVIIEVDGEEIEDLEDFTWAIAHMDGSPLHLRVLREGKNRDITIKPVQSATGEYRLGLWLRDQVSGIGTVTYYDPNSGEYGALGHGINDSSTGCPIPVDGGKTYDAAIVDVVRGQSGDPGELTGTFDTGAVYGTVAANTVYGIFGRCSRGPVGANTMETAAIGEAQIGAAQILSTVSGSEPKLYDIHIDNIRRNGGEERYRITVTDPALLERTGGVVCGMSGSPIIQDGKLVGAVTHVLVNDPTRGYGIFIENMLEAAE